MNLLTHKVDEWNGWLGRVSLSRVSRAEQGKLVAEPEIKQRFQRCRLPGTLRPLEEWDCIGLASGLKYASHSCDRHRPPDLTMIRPARPTLEEIRHYLRGVPFSNWAERARSFAAAETLEPKDHKAYLRTLLYPGRFCYSLITGLMGSNDFAVAFLKESRVPGLDVRSLECALHCRQSGVDPDALFPRTKSNSFHRLMRVSH